MSRTAATVISTRHVLSHRARRHSFWHGRTSLGSRFPPPKQTKPFPVPADERVGLHDDEGVSPLEELSQGHHREPSGVICAARCLLALDKERELLSEKEILRGESTLRTDEIPSERKGVENNGNFREQTQERAFLSRSKATSPMTAAAKRPILAGLNYGINVGASFCGPQVVESVI